MSDDVKEKDVDFVSKTEYSRIQAEALQLQKLVQNLNDENNKIKSKLDSFGGLTPEDVASLKKAALEKQSADTGGDPSQVAKIVEQRVEEARRQLAQDIERIKAEKEDLAAKYKQVTVVTKFLNEYGSDIPKDMRGIAQSIVASHLDLDPESGNVLVRDDRGQVRYSPNNPALRMTPQEYYEEFKRTYPSMVSAQGINKGSLQEGQRITATSSLVPGVDLEKFKTDARYRDSLPVETRVRIYRELNL